MKRTLTTILLLALWLGNFAFAQIQQSQDVICTSCITGSGQDIANTISRVSVYQYSDQFQLAVRYNNGSVEYIYLSEPVQSGDYTQYLNVTIQGSNGQVATGFWAVLGMVGSQLYVVVKRDETIVIKMMLAP
ncbi:MAG TPA: hypothetical protein PK625_00720 [Spirochaetales bacterium]|nr:hypothetical protein [Spirochaetales bacterium]HPE35644.1 hypothetical protein [Spirochaetales bacterium]